MSTFYNVVDAAGYPLIKCAGVIEFADDRQTGEDWAIEYTDADEAEQDAAKFGGAVESFQRVDPYASRNKTIRDAMALIDMMAGGARVGLPFAPETYRQIKAKLRSVMDAHA